MLREVVRPDGGLVRFGYDALGRRVYKRYRGQTTRFIWDGHVPLYEWVEGALEPWSMRAERRVARGRGDQGARSRAADT